MFGMLDYRAHKLLWLLSLPFQIVGKIIFFAVILAAILFAQSTSYSKPVKIVIAFVCAEAAMLVAVFIWNKFVVGAWYRIFFFLIDVVPAHGADAEEARAIALLGRGYELSKKFGRDIGNWTYADTSELVSRMNWRARLLFPVKQRTENVVQELQRIQKETGQQPQAIGASEMEKICN